MLNIRKRLFDYYKLREFCPVCQLEHVKDPFPPPSNLWEIGAAELNALGFPSHYRTDSAYRVVTVDDFTQWLAYDEIDKQKYVANFYDCDNFAHDLVTFANRWVLGLAIGEIWINNNIHAQNIVVVKENDELAIVRIEPQSDRLHPLDWETVSFMRF